MLSTHLVNDKTTALIQTETINTTQEPKWLIVQMPHIMSKTAQSYIENGPQLSLKRTAELLHFVSVFMYM